MRRRKAYYGREYNEDEQGDFIDSAEISQQSRLIGNNNCDICGVPLGKERRLVRYEYLKKKYQVDKFREQRSWQLLEVCKLCHDTCVEYDWMTGNGEIKKENS